MTLYTSITKKRMGGEENSTQTIVNNPDEHFDNYRRNINGMGAE